MVLCRSPVILDYIIPSQAHSMKTHLVFHQTLVLLVHSAGFHILLLLVSVNPHLEELHLHPSQVGTHSLVSHKHA